MRRVVSGIALILAAGAGVHAGGLQRAWQADVRVRALDVTADRAGDSIAVRLVVGADGDEARAVRLEILLPVGVGVLTLPDECRASPGPVMSLSARVTCTLGNIESRAERTISITTTSRPRSSTPMRFAAFALSDTPDPLPANNFAERTLR